MVLTALVCLPGLLGTAAHADNWQCVGDIQHESLFPTADVSSSRNSPRAPWAKIDHLSNSYVDVGVRYTKDSARTFMGLEAATRVELMEWPMLGYDAGFKGHGIGHLHLSAHWRWGEITLGDVYGQFGSGFILRLYEERSLGIDNSLRGGKISALPYDGIRVEVLGGKQRRYWNCYTDRAWGWNYTQDAVVGGNVELNIDRWSKYMQDNGAALLIGGSYVSKYQAFDTIIARPGYYYNLPKWVGAADARVNFQMKGWNALVEYAYKANDPIMENGFSYRHGEALLASLSYSRKGLSFIVQVKRSENMSFRSDRMAPGNAGRINHLPAFDTQHTYALPSLNSYATQMNGEWAFQGEIRHTWKRGTKMGGKYGTTLKLNASHIRGLGNRWFDMPETYYTDVNVELNKKLTREWSLNAMLMYQTFNKKVVEGHGELMRSGIGVVDVKWVTSKNVQMRAELQYLYTPHEDGQWIYALYELSLFKQLMISLSEQYCIGHGTNTNEQGNHYYSFMATWQRGAHLLSAGYVKTLAGYNCAGGVCRYVPEQQGVMLRYNFTW